MDFLSLNFLKHSIWPDNFQTKEETALNRLLAPGLVG